MLQGILTTFGEKIKTKLTELKTKLEPCQKTGRFGIKSYDFTSLGSAEEKKAILETMHGLRFLFEKMTSGSMKTSFFEGDDALKTFTTSDLKTFEKELEKKV